MPSSSCAASCCTSFRRASPASGTTAFWPTAIARTISRGAATSSGQVTTPEWHAEVREENEENDEGDERLCPKCKMGHMVRWKRLSAMEAVSRQLEELRKIDSS